MKIIFSVLTLFIIFLEACTKCNSTTDYLTAQQKAFANFKPGSYWILRDSASGTLDSFVVVTVGGWIGVKEDKSGVCDDKREGFSINIEEYNNQVKIDTAAWNMEFFGGGGLFAFTRWGGRSGNPSFVTGGSLDFITNNMVVNGVSYDSVSLGGRVFAHPRLKLLKIIASDTVVWELERAHIIN